MPALVLFFMAVLPSFAHAGVYGAENWGEMYWGENPTSPPTGLPIIESVTTEADQITIALSEFPQGTGEDGWSAVTSYTVTCGESSADTIGNAVTITGLDSDTEYSCSISAVNAEGEGPSRIELVITDRELNGLNILLICSALDCNSQSDV